jgi:mono/diheme cytochrome c family protein
MFTNLALKTIKMNRRLYIIGIVCASTLALTSCKEDPDSPGVEYMPDMYRSPALEAYVDYGNNKSMDWTQQMKAEAGINPVLSRQPVAGTIPHVKADMAAFVMPYPLNNTPEDYERSATEITSPIQSTKKNVLRGQEIYTTMCTHCHGEAGHGDGAISKNGHIQGIPDYAGKLKDLSVGKMFHTLTYGKGLMGQHASQLNQLERWQVIEWVKLLQKGITEPEFDSSDMLKMVATSTASTDSTSTTK